MYGLALVDVWLLHPGRCQAFVPNIWIDIGPVVLHNGTYTRVDLTERNTLQVTPYRLKDGAVEEIVLSS